MIDNGWQSSAEAWLKSMGKRGDWSRIFVLDPAMLERIDAGNFKTALDVGCGEGRFCRLLKARGVDATGIDSTPRLVEAARAADPDGAYYLGDAQSLTFEDASFDLVVSYLSLIDIPDFRRAISEMTRVLAPGGALLVANLSGHMTSRVDAGWRRNEDGERESFAMDCYLGESERWEEWAGIRILNYHRPLSAYMQAYLGAGLDLVHFAEPEPIRRGDAKAEQFMRIPFFNLMEWRKPA